MIRKKVVEDELEYPPAVPQLDFWNQLRHGNRPIPIHLAAGIMDGGPPSTTYPVCK